MDIITTQKHIIELISEIFRSGIARDFEKLESHHMYGPKFSKFSFGTKNRINAEQCRIEEKIAFAGAEEQKFQLIDPKVDLFGDIAIATFMCNLSFSVNSVQNHLQAKSTMVFSKTDQGWKIVHEHFSKD